MSDLEIVQGLLNKDNHITNQFLYITCRPLFLAIFKVVFHHKVEYDDMIAEFYKYLMEQDGYKLKKFQYRSSIYQWIKVVATRFFIGFHNKYVTDVPKEGILIQDTKDVSTIDPLNSIDNKIDIENLLGLIDNPRYVEIIKELVLKDKDPKEVAKKLGVTIDNLYNIKKRALQDLARIAMKYYSYER